MEITQKRLSFQDILFLNVKPESIHFAVITPMLYLDPIPILSLLLSQKS
jgi:hypothetical protein